MRDVEDSLRTPQQDASSDHSPVSPVGRVFNDTSLRQEVLRCLGPGYWLYIAGTSKALRSAYMAVLAAHQNIAVLAVRNQVHRVMCATSGAAAAQSISTFRMAQECGISYGQLGAHSFRRAVGRSGSVELIRLAAAAGMHGNKAIALAGAAETCSIEAIEELYHHRLESNDSGDQDPYLATGRPKFDEALDAQMTVCERAITVGSRVAATRIRDVLIWVSAQARARQDWPEWFLTGLCCSAARGGHLEALRWLMTSGVALFGPYSHDMTTSYPKKGGRYDPRYGTFNQCFSTATSTIYSIMDAAVFSGRLAVVQWLRAQSFAFTAASANLAAALGHLPLLRWLHAQGTEACPFAAASIVECTLSGYVSRPGDGDYRRSHVLRLSSSQLPSAAVWAWLRGIGALVWFTPEMRARLLRNACERGDGAARVQWLLSRGAAWPNDLAEVVENDEWSPRAACRAVELGCAFGEGWTSATCKRIIMHAYCIRSGHDLVQILHLAGCPCSCPRPALAGAQK
eukprot:TRINITY_DN1574_c0_g1_i1.p1 TRINITY_DN1574_c0_g1~~TRINITY_DN1574_c0_g1_i1.p1  ORF type:complete len:514 (+),score=60.50 TRINITY_DN1574_c0_g1_i1:312-1853(+)